MNKSVYAPLPTVARVRAFGQLEQFYDKRIQSVLRKWSPKIRAEDILEVFRFVCRMTNYSRAKPPTRPEKFFEVYLREPRLFAELLWTLEQVTYSNRDGTEVNLPSKSAKAGYLYRQSTTHNMGEIARMLKVSAKAAAQALRNQRDAENKIQAWWLKLIEKESKAQK
jgi:hypothetical protein